MTVFGADQVGRQTPSVRQHLEVNLDAQASRFIHHVQHDDRRDAQRAGLHDHASLPVDLRGIQHQHEQIARGGGQKRSDHLFIVRESLQVIDAGQVYELDQLIVQTQARREEVNRDARPVADARSSMGDTVKQHRLATVGLAQDGNPPLANNLDWMSSDLGLTGARGTLCATSHVD